MPGPMEGVKVVEVGQWVAGPAAAAVLGYWGADVVKTEPAEGDPFRGLLPALGAGDTSPPFELDNRNKRSVALNLALAEGREIAGRLVDGADVLVPTPAPAPSPAPASTSPPCRSATPGSSTRTSPATG